MFRVIDWKQMILLLYETIDYTLMYNDKQEIVLNKQELSSLECPW